MQYTGLTQVTGNEPPTYACVGTKDNIASYRSVEYYIARLESAGTNAEVEVFKGLPMVLDWEMERSQKDGSTMR